MNNHYGAISIAVMIGILALGMVVFIFVAPFIWG